MLNEMDYLAAGYYKTNTDFKMTTWAGWSGFMLTLIPLSYRLCRLFARKRSTRAADFFLNASLTMVVALYGVVSYFTLRWILFYKAIPLWAGISYATSLWALFLWLQRASFGCICWAQKANVERSGRS
ncbi:znrf3 [Symbiodinium sp. CCMP2592]|nr:znrf3 [Symbiodinium sp. CCMP2592]